MAITTIVYKNAVMLIEGRDISAELYQLMLDYKVEILDRTTFGNDTRIHVGGLYEAVLSAEGYADFAALAPDLMFTLLGTDDSIITVFPNGVTVGTACGYALKAVVSLDAMGGDVGSLETIKVEAQSRGVQA